MRSQEPKYDFTPPAARKWTGFLLALLFALAAVEVRGDFIFVQICDTQFGFANKDLTFEAETAHFEQAAAAINRLKPAFVVACGDLVNRPGDAAQIAEFKRISSQIDRAIPVYNAPGNHDVENSPTASSVEKYRSVFGKDFYMFEHGDFRGIVLNSVLIHTPVNAMDLLGEQEKWVAGALAEAQKGGPRTVCVFQHHPLFLKDPNEPTQYFNIPQQRRRQYLDMFKGAGVKAVFAGHFHRNSLGRDEGLEMVTSGAVGKSLGADPEGLRVVRVGAGGILEHRYYALGAVPERIDPSKPLPEGVAAAAR